MEPCREGLRGLREQSRGVSGLKRLLSAYLSRFTSKVLGLRTPRKNKNQMRQVCLARQGQSHLRIDGGGAYLCLVRFSYPG